MDSLKTATFNDTSCKSENNLFMQKTFHRKNDARFFTIIFFSQLVWWKTFFACFFIHAFLRVKKYRWKKYSSYLVDESIFRDWNCSSFYRLPHFLSVKWRFPIKNVFQNQKIWKIPIKEIVGFTITDSSCSKLSYANCSKVSYIYITYLYTTY